MMPQFAHHPRPFGNSAFATPPFEPPQDSGAPNQLVPLAFRNPRGPAHVPAPDRPYPVESHASRNALAVGQLSAGRYNDSAEHMLRRKTPNGTLAAGYDGTAIQFSSKVPALKHVVLPMSVVPSNQQSISSGTAPTEHRARQRSNSLGWNGHLRGANAGSTNGRMPMNNDPGNWSYFSSNQPPNVLNHLSMQQAATFYPNNGMQIPTVIQPGYQASPGPTASNDGGLYGPYWPDGKFVPYRPAAYRGQGHQLGYPLENQGFQQQVNPPADLLSTFQQPHYNHNSTPHVRRPSFPVLESSFHPSETGFPLPSQNHQSSHSHGTATPTTYSSLTDGSRTPTAQSTNRPNSHQFKEKTLSWAHSIYVDLLAFLHQSKRDSRHSRHSQGIRTKATIYPKPPRQPASSFGNSDWSAPYASASGNGHSDVRGHWNPGFTNSHRSHSTSSLGGWQGSADFTEVRYSRSSNQDMPHYVSPFHPPQRSAEPPLRKAKEALEILTTLCEQSGWLWIDGILLGGCLAYGLEEYQKALNWYSKIIALDPK